MSTIDTDTADIKAAITLLEDLAICKENNLDLTQTWATIVRRGGYSPERSGYRGGKFYQAHIKHPIRSVRSVEKILASYGVMGYLDDFLQWSIYTHSSADGKPRPSELISPRIVACRITLSKILEVLKAGHPSASIRVDIIERELEKARERVKELEGMLSREFKSMKATLPTH